MRTVPFAPPYAALVVLAFSMACSSSQPSTDTAPAATVSGPGVVTGTATYREQVTLPDDATFEAVLQDVSRVDAPPTAIGRQRIEDVSKSPISFAISFDPSLINPERNYVVRASIRVDERRIWVSSRAHSVLTHGTGNSVHIMLRRVGVADDKIDGDLLLAGDDVPGRRRATHGMPNTPSLSNLPGSRLPRVEAGVRTTLTRPGCTTVCDV